MKEYFDRGDYHDAYTDIEAILNQPDVNDERYKVYSYWKGFILWKMGNLKKTFDYLKSIQSIFGSVDKYDAGYLNLIGTIHVLSGQLEDSLKYYQQSLDLRRELGDLNEISGTVNNLGVVNQYLGKHNNALDYFIQAYEIKKNIDEPREIEVVLSNIIQSSLELGNRDQAKNYLDLLEDLGLDGSDVHRLVHYKFSRGLYLKSSNRNRHKTDAERIFWELIKENNFQTQLKIRSYYHLIELLLYEYKLYEQPVVFEEIQGLIDEIYQITSKSQYIPRLVEVLLLRSKLVRLLGRYQASDEYIREAQSIAIEHQLGGLIFQINREIKGKDNEIKIIKKLIENDLPVSSRIDSSNLFQYVTRGQKPMQYAISKYTPVMVMILNEGGSLRLKCLFMQDLIERRINHNLLGSFINAISLFGGETFGTNTTELYEMSYSDFRIRIKNECNHQFCYIYQGQDKQSSSKLKKFVNFIKSKSIYIDLKQSTSLELSLSDKERKVVNEIFY